MQSDMIRSMGPGKELDKLVAIHVMGWSIYHYDKDVPERCYYMLVDSELDPVADDEPWTWSNGERTTEEAAWEDNRPWSSDISAVWEIMKLPKVMDRYQIGVYPTSFGKWIARPFMPGYNNCDVMADDAPEAICKATLLATLAESNG